MGQRVNQRRFTGTRDAGTGTSYRRKRGHIFQVVAARAGEV